MLFSPDLVQRAVDLLRSSIEVIDAKAGCHACMLARDAVEEGRVHYIEEWSSDDAFQRHLHSGEFQRVLVAVDMCSEEPEVTIGNLSGHSGLAYLLKLRNQKSTPAGGTSA